MPVNDFYPFATGTGANVISQATWAAGTLSQGQTRAEGFLGGKDALSQEANKVWRQSQFMAAAIAKYVADNMNVDVLDNGDLAGFLANFTSALTKSSGRKKVTGTGTVLNLYVATTGSNSNDGLTSTTPFLTLQKAWDYLRDSVDLNGNYCTINVAPGIYAPLKAYGAITGSKTWGSVIIQGDLTTPSNCVISAFSDNAVMFYGTHATIKGFGIQATGATFTSGVGLFSGDSYIEFDRMDFGACSTAHFGTTERVIQCAPGGSYSISGSANEHAYAFLGGQTFIIDAAVTIAAAVNFPEGFVWAQNQGYVQSHGCTFSGSSSVTGPRYLARAGGIVDTQGSGASYFPGSGAGAADGATGGYYF